MKRMDDSNESTPDFTRLVATDPAITRRDHELRTGQWIDNRYVVVRTIGWGSTGAVYEAEDLRLQRRVAVKLIHPSVAADPLLCEMFLTEAECMARLRHPNVVEVFDVGQVGPSPYLVMPLLVSQNLAVWARARRGPPLPPDIMLGVIGQVSAGVSAMHRVNLVHGDLKPSNLLVSDEFRMVVADLGLARAVSEGRRFSLAGATPGYLAPELIISDDVDPEHAFKIDVYALGVIGYWLLTGRTPAGRGSTEQVLRRQIDEDPRPPSVVRPELSAAFDEPLLAALHRDPAQRPDVAGLCSALFGARHVASETSTGPTPLVVIVHGESAQLSLIERVVGKRCSDVEVLAFADSQQALAAMQRRPPNVVITALELPRLNGIELVASLRGSASTQHVPVVVVSGAVSAGDRDLLRTLGASRVLLDPTDTELLGYAVERAIVEARAQSADRLRGDPRPWR